MAMPEESLQDYLDKQQGVTQPGFAVDDDQKADWALRKIASLRAKQKDVVTQADEQIAVIEQWEKERIERLEKDVERFESLLTNYAAQKRSENPKFKTLLLAHGKIGFRKQQPKWTVGKLVGEWLFENGHRELVRVKKEPELAKLKKAGFIIKGNRLVDPDSGEIVPDVEVEEREDKPIVEVN